MPLYLAHCEGKDKLAARVPFYIPKACFIQNFYTDRAVAFMLPSFALSVAALLFSIVSFPWLFIVSIPLVLFCIVQSAFGIYLSQKGFTYNDTGARRINVYWRLPENVRKDLKPLAKYVYKNAPGVDDRTKGFWLLLDEYAEKYPPPEPVADPLDELIEKHKQTLKAWNDEL